MIDIEEARRTILANTPAPARETVPLALAAGRVLAADVHAREPVPFFDSSAMDGFAVHCADTAGASRENPVALPVARTIRAGDEPGPFVARGHAVRIMTGAPVPEGPDAVVIKENTEDLGETVRIESAVGADENVRRRGKEFAAGDLVLTAGTRVTPPVAGLLSSLGRPEATVFAPPRVAVVITGSELAGPGEALSPGRVRDANSFSLAAALGVMGVEHVAVRRTGDDLEETRAALAAALDEAEVAITSGGVSLGDFDFVKDAAEAVGVKTLFWRIAMKPGRPNYFGRKGDKLFFGLPGNSVSVLVSLHEVVRPALLKLLGRDPDEPALVRARLEGDLSKKKGRLEFVRGILKRAGGGEGRTVAPIKERESHMLGGLARANCLILFPREESRLEAGETVEARPLFWRMP